MFTIIIIITIICQKGSDVITHEDTCAQFLSNFQNILDLLHTKHILQKMSCILSKNESFGFVSIFVLADLSLSSCLICLFYNSYQGSAFRLQFHCRQYISDAVEKLWHSVW